MVGPVKSRWEDIPEMRVECAKLVEQNLNSRFIADTLNTMFGKQLRALQYSPMTKNMVISEKHRERTKQRRIANKGQVIETKGNKRYLNKAIIEVDPPVPFEWMKNPIFDMIRIKPRKEEIEPELEELD